MFALHNDCTERLLAATEVNPSEFLSSAQDLGSLPRGLKGGVRSLQLGCLVWWCVGYSGRLHASPKFCSLWRLLVLRWVWYCVLDGQCRVDQSKSGGLWYTVALRSGVPDAIPCSLGFEVDWLLALKPQGRWKILTFAGPSSSLWESTASRLWF